MNNKHIKNTLTLQLSQHTCGLACLTSIVKFHGGFVRQEQLFEISGTTLQGTSMFGLLEAAQKLGFDVEGYEADLENLKEMKTPVILHVIKEGNTQHYIICYSYNEKFIIGDPACGITQYSEEELNAIWPSKAMLVLTPSKNFVKKDVESKRKRNWIMELIKPDIPILIISAIIGIIAGALGISIAVFSQKLIDNFLPKHKINEIIWGLALVCILLIIRVGLLYIRGFLNANQSKDFANRIIHSFFHKILYLPKSFFDVTKSCEFTSRINDLQRIQKIISSITGNIIIDAVIIMISAGTLFFYSWISTIVILASIPVFMIFVYSYKEKILTVQRDIMVANALTDYTFLDIIQGNNEIKVFNRHKLFHSVATGFYFRFQDMHYHLAILGNQFGFYMQMIGVVFTTAILALGSLLALNGKLQVGEFVAMLILSMSIIPAIFNLAFANVQFLEGKVAFDRIFEMTLHRDEHEEVADLKKSKINSIDIRALSFGFPGRLTLLDNISLKAEKNQIITLFGEIGCGKSTLLKILQKLYIPQSAKIYVNGEDWEQFSIPEWRENVAVVPQHIKTFSGTLAENIVLGDVRNEREQFISFCNKYNFNIFFEQFPQGYMTNLGEDGSNVSGGQLQLMALARALYKKPQVLLLDDATSAMDRKTEDFVLTLLNNLKENLIIIIVTHSVQVARKTDFIYILNNGRIEHFGTHDQLIENNNLYSNSFLGTFIPDFSLNQS